MMFKWLKKTLEKFYLGLAFGVGYAVGILLLLLPILFILGLGR